MSGVPPGQVNEEICSPSFMRAMYAVSQCVARAQSASPCEPSMSPVRSRFGGTNDARRPVDASSERPPAPAERRSAARDSVSDRRRESRSHLGAARPVGGGRSTARDRRQPRVGHVSRADVRSRPHGPATRCERRRIASRRVMTSPAACGMRPTPSTCRVTAATERGPSPAASRRRAGPMPSPGGSSAPRTSTSGRRLILPEASSAAEAISSATATTVACITRPSASGRPRWSSSGSKPATPSATSTIPQRHGRPNESLTMTADLDAEVRRDPVADARAPSGRSPRAAASPCPPSPTFEASTPALAHTKP